MSKKWTLEYSRDPKGPNTQRRTVVRTFDSEKDARARYDELVMTPGYVVSLMPPAREEDE